MFFLARPLAVIALPAMLLAAMACVAAPLPLGKWRAVSTQPDDGGVLVLDIAKVADGKISILPLGTSGQPIQLQRQVAAVSGDRLVATWNEGDYLSGFFPLDFAGQMRGRTILAAQPDGRGGLHVSVSDERRTRLLAFLPYDDPVFRRFDVPRIDEAGNPVRQWDYRPPSSLDWAPAANGAAVGVREAGLAALVDDVLGGRYGRITSVTVVQDGRLVLDEYFHGATRDDLHTVMSITKSFTAMAYGVELGRHPELAVDTPVWRYFPERGATRWVRDRVAVTVADLLRMAPVTPYDESGYADPENPLMKSSFAADPIEDYLNYDLNPLPAGPEMAYLTTYTMLTGEILRKVTGKSPEALIEADILQPLGIRTFAMPLYDRADRRAVYPDGNFLNGSFLQLRPADLAKVGQMVLDRGRWQGKAIVPAEWLADATTVRSYENWPGIRIRQGYGYQFWSARLRDAKGKDIWMTQMEGLNGQLLAIIPATRTVIAITALGAAGEDGVLAMIADHIAPSLPGIEGPVSWGAIGPNELGTVVLPATAQ